MEMESPQLKALCTALWRGLAMDSPNQSPIALLPLTAQGNTRTDEQGMMNVEGSPMFNLFIKAICLKVVVVTALNPSKLVIPCLAVEYSSVTIRKQESPLFACSISCGEKKNIRPVAPICLDKRHCGCLVFWLLVFSLAGHTGTQLCQVQGVWHFHPQQLPNSRH